MKTHKFIKDKNQEEEVIDVLRDYYPELKDQFATQIGNIENYPVVSWLDFVNACKDWKIVDKNLSQQDIDRIFIAVNFEEVDLEANDDKSLCRYEFLEIMVRMAKQKYLDKGTADTMAEAVNRLITQYIIPNTCEIMPWQAFRDNELWNLEIDDLFKANAEGIIAIYKKFKKSGKQRGMLDMGDCRTMLSEIGFTGTDNEKKVCIAYSLSK